jgi:hypothetical protein
MAPDLRLTIENGQFRDRHGRQVMLRGINVAGDAKLPSEPDQPSHVADDFFDGDNVRFHGRPFTLDDAPLHLSRLRRYGYNTIRYVFTWEAVEAAGPGRYDEEFIQHTIRVLRVAKEYGFYVIMDPHQDVWSRFSGGSGAPMWTLYAAGLNPQSFLATEAAIVHNTYPDPDEMPKMIWATNYFRLAAATMFTLFWAGREFAPKCIIDGVNIQDYLQTHFANMCAHFARRIHEAGDLEDEVVIGWESINEPNPSMVGHPDLTVLPDSQPLKKGTAPTAWQTFLTGMGRACEVETWDVGGMGPYKVGRKLVDPHGEKAWLPEGYDDSRYGWKRDPEWKLGQCIWAMHGVWDPETDTLLQKEYFRRKPGTDLDIDHQFFVNTYFMDYYRGWRDAIRAVHKESILILQGPTLQTPPQIKGTADDDPKMAYAPHWYDGITLMTKHFNRTWNVDVIGVLRGKYWSPVFAIRVGETAIRNCFKDQVATLRQEAIDFMGNHPVVMTEFGVPYDMDDQAAYKTGDYTSQSAAMDANYYAVEGSGLEGHCLWVYVPTNDHRHGDQWNGEDLSITSVDDKPLPLSAVPRGDDGSLGASSTDLPRPSLSHETGDEQMVTPKNLERTLTSPSISSELSRAPAETSLNAASGFRAAEAYVRPSPVVVAGDLKSYGFDLRNCTFNLAVAAPETGAGQDSPTVVYLPEYHFPRDGCEVLVSSGKWELRQDDSEGGVPVQKLFWWHLGGKQTLRVTGPPRQYNVPAGSAEELGYLEQCWRTGGGSCVVM